MVKWNIFSKSKKSQTQSYQDPNESRRDNYSPVVTDENLTFEKETTDQPIAEYHETLQTKNSDSSKNSSHEVHTRSSSDQRIWRDVKAIEENIDNIHISKSNKPTSELEKKVDTIIKKKEKK